jgi:hypothetical protein
LDTEFLQLEVRVLRGIGSFVDASENAKIAIRSGASATA